MNCELCPRRCGADRSKTQGFCGMGIQPKVVRASLHHWEEPCISGDNGSGTVFFSGCVMRCVFCQNHEISAGGFGVEITTQQLSQLFLRLKSEGAHNINLVNPTHFVPQIIEALDMVKGELDIPIVYNSGGYERVDTLKQLEGYIDIYLPDVKYFSDEAAVTLSGALRKEVIPRIDASFFVANVEYLHKGGRCSSIAALGANLLKLRPCIDVIEGKMKVTKKYRGNMVKCITEYVQDRITQAGDIENSLIFVTSTTGDIYTKMAVDEIKKHKSDFSEIAVTDAGCTVACHCGEDTLGILFIRKNDRV